MAGPADRMLALLGLAMMRGPALAVVELSGLLSEDELSDLIARLIDELDRRHADPDLEPDCDLEPEPELAVDYVA
jgi:hypothetical protein